MTVWATRQAISFARGGGRMRKYLRQDDCVARLGGDEFIILLRDGRINRPSAGWWNY